MNPLVRGDRDKGKEGPVHDAQFLLAQNRWDVNFHPGPRDGIFGDQMAEAIRRAKFYLGYPQGQIVPVFGDRLYHYLLAKDKGGWTLPVKFRARKAARRPKPTSKRDLVCAYARWSVNHAYDIHYAQVRPIPYLPWRLPISTDCSGLATMAYNAAGALNELGSDGRSGNTDTLQAHGTTIPRSRLRPGDLVFYAHPDHVGIYMGSLYVVEHGSEGAPRWEPVDYRPITSCRSYLR